MRSNRVVGKGASTTISLVARKSGAFAYYCSVPGHREADMLGKLIVEPGPRTGPASVAPDVSRDPGPYLLFKERLAHRMHEFLKSGAFGVMTAEAVAKVILQAAKATRPRTRYNVEFIARFGPLGRALAPDRLVDFATRRSIANISIEKN